MINYRLAVLTTLVLALIGIQSFGQCTGTVPAKTGNAMQDFYNEFQAFECSYPFRIQSDPVFAGFMQITNQHGPCEAIFKPYGKPASPETAITINGQKALIEIGSDRSSPYAYNWIFQQDILQIKNSTGVVYQAGNGEVYPSTIRTSGNIVSNLYDVGDATETSGVIRAGTISQPGRPSERCLDGRFKIVITRDPSGTALGVFTIPVLPVSMGYVPPPGALGKNTVRYSIAQGTTRKVTTTLNVGQSTKVPISYDGSPNALASGLKGLGEASKSFSPVISGLLGFVGGNLGSESGSKDQGQTRGSSEGFLTAEVYTGSQTFGGTTNQGTVAQPGMDDSIWVVKGLRMAWVSDGAGKLNLITLGAKEGAPYTIRDLLHDEAILKANQPSTPAPQQPTSGDNEFSQPSQPSSPNPPKNLRLPAGSTLAAHKPIHISQIPQISAEPLITGLDLQSVEALLALDPMLKGGANVNLLSPEYKGRFQFTPFIEPHTGVPQDELTIPPSSVAYDYEIELQVSTTRSNGVTNFTTTVQDDKPGLLGKIFSMGPQTEQTITTSSSIVSNNETTTSTTQHVQLHIEPGQTSIVLRAYQDLAFGSFIFQEVTDASMQAEGIATDEAGNPQGNQWVSLSIGNKRILTRTDAQGRYTFYSSNATPGKGQLAVRGKVKIIDIVPAPKTLKPIQHPPMFKPK